MRDFPNILIAKKIKKLWKMPFAFLTGRSVAMEKKYENEKHNNYKTQIQHNNKKYIVSIK